MSLLFIPLSPTSSRCAKPAKDQEALLRAWFGLRSHSLFVPLGSLPGANAWARVYERASARAVAIVIVSGPSEPDRKGLSGADQGVGSRVVWCTLIATVRSHQHQTEVLGPESVPCWARLPGSEPNPISTLRRVSTSIPQIGYVGGRALSDRGSRGG
jgi:hypothetical protein